MRDYDLHSLTDNGLFRADGTDADITGADTSTSTAADAGTGTVCTWIIDGQEYKHRHHCKRALERSIASPDGPFAVTDAAAVVDGSHRSTDNRLRRCLRSRNEASFLNDLSPLFMSPTMDVYAMMYIHANTKVICGTEDRIADATARALPYAIGAGIYLTAYGTVFLYFLMKYLLFPCCAKKCCKLCHRGALVGNRHFPAHLQRQVDQRRRAERASENRAWRTHHYSSIAGGIAATTVTTTMTTTTTIATATAWMCLRSRTSLRAICT
jgi:hypothetical protein